MLAAVSAQRCVDTARVFATGYSSGSWLVNSLDCRRADKLRGAATVSGGYESSKCSGEIARIFIHDTDDTDNVIAGSITERTRLIAANHCSMTTLPDDPPPCVRYQGCDAAYPIDWCQTSGKMHDRQDSLAPGAFWKFFTRPELTLLTHAKCAGMGRFVGSAAQHVWRPRTRLAARLCEAVPTLAACPAAAAASVIAAASDWSPLANGSSMYEFKLAFVIARRHSGCPESSVWVFARRPIATCSLARLGSHVRIALGPCQGPVEVLADWGRRRARPMTAARAA